MDTSTQPCHKDNFFFDAFEEVKSTEDTHDRCHIWYEPFDVSAPDTEGIGSSPRGVDNLNQLAVLPFDFRRGYDLSRHTAVQLRRCGHIFGLPCLTTWLLDGEFTSCPACREEIVVLDESQDAFGPTHTIDVDWEPEATDDTTREEMFDRAFTNERSYRVYAVSQSTIRDLCQDTLEQYEDEKYSVRMGRDDIALLLGLWILMGAGDQDEKDRWHDRMIKMALGVEEDIEWLHFMENELERFAKQEPFDPSHHFPNLVTLLQLVLKHYACRSVSPRTLFKEMNDELDEAIEQHSRDFPSHQLETRFVERAKQGLQYFVAWWKMAGHVWHPTRFSPLPADSLPSLKFFYTERICQGFQRIDWNAHGPTLAEHLRFYGGSTKVEDQGGPSYFSKLQEFRLKRNLSGLTRRSQEKLCMRKAGAWCDIG